jgi:hypothetical protein
VLCPEHQQNAREMGPRTIAWTRAVLASPSFSIEGAELDAEGCDLAARKLTSPMASFFAQLLDRAPSSLALLEAERL